MATGGQVGETGWHKRPRSRLWKLIVSLIWIGACLTFFFLFVFAGGSRIDSMPRGDEQFKAASEFTGLMKVLIPGTFIATIAGIIFIAKRPKLNG